MADYDYPPSQYILAHGPLAPDSHHVCTGTVQFEGFEASCKFEAAYTHDCQIIVIMYLSGDDYRSAYFNRQESLGETVFYVLPATVRNRYVGMLRGEDLKTGQSVELEDCTIMALGAPLGIALFDEPPPTYTAKTMRVMAGADTTESARVAIFGVTGVDLGSMFHSEIEFITRTEPHRKVDLKRITGNRPEYPNAIAAQLHIAPDAIPEGYSARAIADLWCAASALALGRTVTWCYQATEGAVREVWHMRTGIHAGTRAFALVNDGWDTTPYAEYIPFVQAFIDTCVQRRISESFASELSVKVRNHVSHRVNTTRAIDQLRLVTTSTEELVLWLAQELDLRVSSAISGAHQEAFLEALKVWLRENLRNAIPDGEDSVAHRKFVKRKLIYFTKKELAAISLEDRLDFLLLNSAAVAQWYARFGRASAIQFAKLRNSVAHAGKFPYDNQLLNRWLYVNAIMMFPRVIFAAIGFTAPYRDWLLELGDELPDFPE